MCGIAGLVDFNKASSIEVLQQCTDTLLHRGPDGSDYKFFNDQQCHVGLGHRRLSIIDLSDAGKQPKQYKQYWITFNGEIYNFEELKATLVSLGHSFSSHSDTEVILHCYEEYGHAMLDKFIGMFAFVIYDSVKQEIVCCRDRAGVKPFYYYYKDGLFLFASELKAFHQHPGFKKSIDLQAVHQFFQYGYIMAPLCIFKNTYKLVQGHYLILSLQTKTITISKYWDVYDCYNQPKLKINETEALRETEKIIQSACNYRMVADVPIGVFLSGGYDSTIVTALLQKDSTEKIKTFSIGFDEESYNEAHFAKEVATHLGTHHTEYYCTAREAQEIIPYIPDYYDEPNGDSSIIPTTLVSRLAKQQVKVALSADAGDETFAGYSKYTMGLDFKRQLQRLPYGIRSIAGLTLKHTPDFVLNTLTNKISLSYKKGRYGDLLLQKNITITKVVDSLLNHYFSDLEMNSLIHTRTNKPQNPIDAAIVLKDNLDDVDKMLAVDYKTYMTDDVLVKVDRASMSASLEGREPLVDHRIIEFVATLPASLKLHGNIKKYLLKKIVHQYVPQQMMDRPKMGFGVPVFKWLREELKPYTDHFLTDESFAEHNLFSKKEIAFIKHQFYKGNENYNSIFWNMLSFQMWYKKWM